MLYVKIQSINRIRQEEMGVQAAVREKWESMGSTDGKQ